MGGRYESTLPTSTLSAISVPPLVVPMVTMYPVAVDAYNHSILPLIFELSGSKVVQGGGVVTSPVVNRSSVHIFRG